MKGAYSKSYFAGAVLIAGLAFIIVAAGYDSKARLMPVIVALPTVALAAYLLVRELAGNKKAKPSEEADQGVEFKGPQEVAGGLVTFKIFLSLAVFAAAVFLLGFIPTIPLFLSGFLILISRKKALTAVIFSLAFTAVIYALFVVLLNAQMYKGLLF